jgi:hypothetical protein
MNKLFNLDLKTLEDLKEISSHYSIDDFNIFYSELGWWDFMNLYTESEEGEELTESELRVLENDFKELFLEFKNME